MKPIRNFLAPLGRTSIFFSLALAYSDLKCQDPDDSFHVLRMAAKFEINRADIWYVEPPPRPRAILVLCPGANGNGLSLIQQKAWREYAARENLALAGIRFESPISLLSQCQGYYQARNGSGDLLLDGIESICGKKLPILFFGFSGGAHYITRFIAWNPRQVLGWVAAGAGVLDAPLADQRFPPGIMACGANDSRLGGALTFFKQGRAHGNPWLWVEMPNVGHSFTPEFEDFARDYFSVLLNRTEPDGLWMDIDLLTELTAEEAKAQPSLNGWIPDRSILASWLTCHAPSKETVSKNQ